VVLAHAVPKVEPDAPDQFRNAGDDPTDEPGLIASINVICMVSRLPPSIEGVEDDLKAAQGGSAKDLQQNDHTATLLEGAEPQPTAAWASSPADISKDHFKNAKIIPLYAEATSLAALAAVGEISQLISAWEHAGAKRQRKRRQSSFNKLDRATGTILAGLLLHWSRTQPKASYRSLKTNDFSGEPIGARIFTRTIQAMVAVGLIQQKDGRRTGPNDSFASRYWPTADLLRLAEQHGLTPANIRQHFRFNAPKQAPEVEQPLRLTAPAERKKRPEPLPFDPAAPEASHLLQQIEAMNSFAAGFEVQNALPPRWHRKFTHDWQHHGRYYAVGGEGNYQHKAPQDRLGIQINGEAVVEVDISASHLTLLHAVLGLELPDGDLYAIPGVSRSLAKGWINATISKGSPVKRWSPDMREALGAEAAASPVTVGIAVLARYPFLGCLPQALAGRPWAPAEDRLLSHRLMFIEASIITQAMEELKSCGVLALPMHDGLIVPAPAQDAARAAMMAAGWQNAGVELRLKVDAL
jgi:hypothetical protein